MGITERREREKNERRKNILNCARELILGQGVERVNMEDIAKKAELSKATVYLYFSSKEALLNEICEDTARGFLELLKKLPDSGLKGMAGIKYIWRCYSELFGNSDEMIIIFKVRSYLNSWLPVVSLEGQNKSSYVEAIISTVKNFIDECKAEGIFAPDLDSTVATRLLLSMFSVILENAARIPPEARKSPAVMEGMTNTFQILIRGFAKEGIEHEKISIKSV